LRRRFRRNSENGPKEEGEEDLQGHLEGLSSHFFALFINVLHTFSDSILLFFVVFFLGCVDFVVDFSSQPVFPFESKSGRDEE